MQDSTLSNDLSCRYFNLRNTVLDTSNLFQFIDSLGNVLDEAQERHYERWPILGINVGTPEIGLQPSTYDGELLKFKNWIIDRLNWLDANMPGNCPNVGIPQQLINEPVFNIYPNPTDEIVTISSSSKIKILNIKVYDQIGRFQKEFNSSKVSLIDMIPGLYFLQVEHELGKAVLKAVKQ